MPNVDLCINGRFYAVACDEGQEAHARDLAAMVDMRVRQLVGEGPAIAIGETHLLVLASLTLADELAEAKAALAGRKGNGHGAASGGEDEDLLVAAVDHLTDRIEVIAGRLDRA